MEKSQQENISDKNSKVIKDNIDRVSINCKSKSEKNNNEEKLEEKDESDLLFDDNVNYENRLEVPFLEKQKGDEFLKKQDFDTALKHYSKVIIAIKVLQEDKSISDETLDTDKLIKTYGVIYKLK